MARYDEDLHENLFFQTLVNKFGALYREAADQRWTIFVPRADSALKLKLAKSDFENHIVVPVSGEDGLFSSLNGKGVCVEGGKVLAAHGYRDPRTVKILFEECFFNSREESYQVFCLEQPLEGALCEELVLSLENLEDCKRYLWGESGSERVRRSVDRLLELFSLESGSSMRLVLDASMALYTRAVQELYKLKKFQSPSQKAFCKLAVETYVLASLHKKVFKEVCYKMATKDTVLNKITRNLSDVTPQSLGVRGQFTRRLPRAKAVLSQLNQFATPLEKLYCFKQCVSMLISTEEGSHDSEEGSHEPMTADELLPTLVYLVIVTDVPNWTGNLIYINKFHFSQVAAEEFTYYMTSFEAAVEYIRSESHQITFLTSGISKGTAERLRSSSCHGNEYFSSVASGDVTAVQELLDRERQEAESVSSRLCHPLCSCPACSELLDKNLENLASLFSRDSNGLTGLHHAARLGHQTMVGLLLERGALHSATDHHSSTPLHMACQRGHQSCTLLLLGEGATVNATDNHGNTPLHLACSNGHEECVKALLFNKQHCELNLANEQGDTALHNAARWGYSSIVSVLLTHGAASGVLNKRRESAAQCAHSGKVQELLSEALKRHSASALEDLDSDDSPVLKPLKVGRRMTIRESFSESDRQLKRLFRAVTDGDTNYVRYLFGWEEDKLAKLCHPLCQCVKCAQLRKSPPVSALSVNCRDAQGFTPLHRASLLGHTVMVLLLLEHGALPDVRKQGTEQTPLHLACQYNHRDVVLALLENEANVTVQDVQGNTPLHFSCTNGHFDTALTLLFHGSDVSVANSRGDTALHNAARWNHPSLVNELMLYGAQYTLTNNEGKTPLDLTKDEEVQLLIVKAMNGQLMVGKYAPPKSPPEPPRTPPEDIVRPPTPALFSAVEEEGLFSVTEESTTFPRSHDSSHEKHSGSAPSDAIQVPGSALVEEPGGSWDCVPEALGQSWDNVDMGRPN